MKINKNFTTSELQMLTEMSLSRIRELLIKYKEQGFIKPAGRQKKDGTGSRRLYRLTPAGKKESLIVINLLKVKG